MGYELGKICHGMKPAMMMVLVQIVSAGVTIFYKLATIDGMSMMVLVAYRYLFATTFLTPLSFFLEGKSRPKLTWMIVFQAFLCGLFGCSLGQNLYVASLNLTSTTFASAMANLIPAITFALAVAFGLERMAIGTRGGKAKVLGTLIGIGGAMFLTFYKGMEINLCSTHSILFDQNQGSHLGKLHEMSWNRVLGSILAVSSCLSFATWLILQAKLSEKYPCPYSSSALTCMMASVQAVVFALCMEKDKAQWKLGLNIRLLAVAFSGIVSSSLIFTIIAWCIRIRGPVFVSIFNPLMLVVVALAGCFLLDEKLHLGSILGAVLIVSGLYMVLWGKSKEKHIVPQLIMPSKNTRQSTDDIDDIVTSPNGNNNHNSNNNKTVVLQPEIHLNSPEMMSFHSIGTNLEEKDADIELGMEESPPL